MTRLLIAGSLALVLLFAASAPAGATSRCKQVSFTPNSDDVAGDIRVSGVTCAYARDFIRDSEGRPPRRYRGFSCRKRHLEPELGLAHTRFRCTRGERSIRWRRY